jgi:hypothetical protein
MAIEPCNPRGPKKVSESETFSSMRNERKATMTDPRNEILKLLADNKGNIADNLTEFLIRQVEDLQTVGVDPELLSTNLLTVTASFLVKSFGPVGAAEQFSHMAAACHAAHRLEINSTQSRH